MALAVFEALDNDNDGRLTSIDFAPSGLQPINAQRAQNIQQLFSLFDIDSNGSITQTEFLLSCAKLVNNEIARLKSTSADSSVAENNKEQPEEQEEEDELDELERGLMARSYLKAILLDFSSALAHCTLSGALPQPPPPNRNDSAVFMSVDDNAHEIQKEERQRLPRIGDRVFYSKQGISPRPAVVVGIHPFSNAYDPLYTIKLLDEDIEFETYSYYLQIDSSGTDTPDTTHTTHTTDTTVTDGVDQDGDKVMTNATDTYVAPSSFFPTQRDSAPSLFVANDACRDSAFALFRLLRDEVSSHIADVGQSFNQDDDDAFYPHQFATSPFFRFLPINSHVIDFFSTYQDTSKSNESLSFQFFLNTIQTLGQLHVDQKWQLKQYYYPKDRCVPQSQHLVALANVSVISHLNDLEKLIRLVGRPNHSTTIRSSSTNAIHIEFLMDNQTEREIRDFFRQLDVDGDGEINWVKDYLCRSKFGKAQNYQLARYQTLLNRFDSDGDHTITYDEFISSFQLQGYEFVANQKIQDNYEREEQIVIGGVPETAEYNAELQKNANEHVRVQKDLLHNYIYTDVPTTDMINGFDVTFRPDLATLQLVKEFWNWLSTDIDARRNRMISKYEFSTQFNKTNHNANCNGMSLEQIEYFFNKFDIDQNNAIEEKEMNEVWLQHGTAAMSRFARLNLGWGPERLQQQVNEEVRTYVQRFHAFLTKPYENAFPTTLGEALRTGTNEYGKTTGSGGGGGGGGGSGGSSSSSQQRQQRQQGVVTLSSRTQQYIEHIFSSCDQNKDQVLTQNDFTQ